MTPFCTHRRQLLRAAACGAAWLAAPALVRAQAWPAKAIRFVVAYAPGNQADIVARIVAQELAKRLGHPVVVENVAGAGGAIGVSQTARAPADGYTIGFSAIAALAIAPHLQKLPYDPLADVVPLAAASIVRGSVLVVHPDLPVHDLQQLAAFARSRSAPLTYGTSGTGTLPHLNMETVASALDLRVTHVPYKAVTGGITDLISGRLDMTFDSLTLLKAHIDAGRLRPIAIQFPARHPQAPQVPTFAEQGFTTPLHSAWQMVVAPRGLPPEIAARLASELNGLTARPEVAAKLPPGSEPLALDAAQAALRVRAEHASFGALVKRLGLRGQ
jgi:tripartite-type tricarboxylate transporter receptor subunit TctC